MANTRKLMFLTSRGCGGAIIRRGTVTDIAEPWATRFIDDGTAVEVKGETPKPKAEKPKGKK